MVPEGGDFIFAQALSPRSSIARPPRGAGDMLHVNSFDVKYREDGSVDQFVSDLSVLDGQGRERLRKSISVNDPLRYQVSHRERKFCLVHAETTTRDLLCAVSACDGHLTIAKKALVLMRACSNRMWSVRRASPRTRRTTAWRP